MGFGGLLSMFLFICKEYTIFKNICQKFSVIMKKLEWPKNRLRVK